MTFSRGRARVSALFAAATYRANSLGKLLYRGSGEGGLARVAGFHQADRQLLQRLKPFGHED